MVGPGSPSWGKACDHGPMSPLRGPGRPSMQPRDRVGVAVGPAADRVDGHLDGGVVLAHRALAPVVVAALVGEPVLDEGRRALDALEPGLAPAVAHRGRVGRQRVAGEHGRRPRQHVDGQDAAADVVHVVGVAVVAGAHRDDRLERRRAPRGDLQAVEAAPRDAHHADGARAPRLLREPRDDLDRVLLLLRQVLVLDDPVGVAACRAGRRARPRTRGRRSRGGGGSRGARTRRPCDRAGTRGWPAPDRARRPRGARCARRAACRRPAGSTRGRCAGRRGGSRCATPTGWRESKGGRRVPTRTCAVRADRQAANGPTVPRPRPDG